MGKNILHYIKKFTEQEKATKKPREEREKERERERERSQLDTIIGACLWKWFAKATLDDRYGVDRWSWLQNRSVFFSCVGVVFMCERERERERERGDSKEERYTCPLDFSWFDLPSRAMFDYPHRPEAWELSSWLHNLKIYQNMFLSNFNGIPTFNTPSLISPDQLPSNPTVSKRYDYAHNTPLFLLDTCVWCICFFVQIGRDREKLCGRFRLSAWKRWKSEGNRVLYIFVCLFFSNSQSNAR